MNFGGESGRRGEEIASKNFHDECRKRTSFKRGMRGNKKGLRLCCAGYDGGAATFEGSGEADELV